MKKTLSLSLALLAAGCTTDAPEPYIPVPQPAWVATIQINKVTKHSCRVTGPDGYAFNVSASGTNIGQGLVATRDTNDCYVRDTSGVQCNWDKAEKLQWCRRTNPAYKPAS